VESTDNGLEVIDLQSDPGFAGRCLHIRDVGRPIEGVHRLGRALIEAPETILQELVDAAIQLCGADSAGVSIERRDAGDDKYYEWVATAGEYSKFLHAMLPRIPSACGTCLERGRAQLFRVSKRFFDLMGVKAAEVTDGILLPWRVDEVRGTIWILAHGRTEAFDQDDLRIMQILASLAEMGVRQQRLRVTEAKPPGKVKTAAVNDLEKQFDNSLQNIRSVLHAAEWSQTTCEAQAVAEQMRSRLKELSVLMRRLLRLPVVVSRPN
jgi:two-component sensor histidine kinase